MPDLLRLNVAFVIGIAIIVVLVLGRSKIHALLALIIASAVMGLVAGLSPLKTIAAIGDGVAGTAKWILLPVSFGVMLGKLLEVSGGAEQMAKAFIRFTGERKSPVALSLTGWVVSLPVFTDTGYIVLNPLAKAMSSKTKINMMYMGLALCLGLWPGCLLAPPTPQPVAMAGLLGVDIGVMTIAGASLSLLLVAIGLLYVRWVSSKISFLPEERGLVVDQQYLERMRKEKLPGALPAFLSVVIPVILLMCSTLSKVVFAEGSVGREFFSFVGEPYVAILIGLLIGMFWLCGGMTSEERLRWMEEALSSAGIVVCITAGGGALGSVVRAAGIADAWAKAMVSWGIPGWLLGFIIATLIKAAQGSAMITGITTATIVAPLLPQLGVSPLLMALSIGCGSLFCSYFNDSLWWVFVRLTGLNVKEGLMAWTGLSVFLWACSLPIVWILSLVL